MNDQNLAVIAASLATLAEIKAAEPTKQAGDTAYAVARLEQTRRIAEAARAAAIKPLDETANAAETKAKDVKTALAGMSALSKGFDP